MKIYKVKVNGKVYEVELESVTENAAKIEASKELKQEEKQVSTGEGTVVKAPMQGQINAIKVVNGQKVNKGDVLCILEAMKMENEIQSPCSGTVTKIAISKGQTVNNQDIMFVIG